MSTEIVVLLHGLARTSRSMKTIEKRLIHHRYQVLNIDYPSRRLPIPNLAEYIYQCIADAKLPEDSKIHFVGYSMGCILIRELLANYKISTPGNIVLIAPPNQGSEVADFLRSFSLYKWFYGPAGQELTTLRAKENPFPGINYLFGVISGNVCLDPISYFILPKGNDGKVTIQSTKLEGMTDHVTLSASHTFIIYNKAVINQIIYFLQNSKFKHP